MSDKKVADHKDDLLNVMKVQFVQQQSFLHLMTRAYGDFTRVA